MRQKCIAKKQYSANLSFSFIKINGVEHYCFDTATFIDWQYFLFFSFVKGYGVFAAKGFEKGDFLLEYCGRRISAKEADKVNHNYLFGFKYAGKYIW